MILQARIAYATVAACGALLLQGCVALAAPLAAGAIIEATAKPKQGEKAPERQANPEDLANRAPDAATRIASLTLDKLPAPGTRLATESVAAAAMDQPSSRAFAVDETGAMREISVPNALLPEAFRRPVASGTLQAFRDFALDQAKRDPVLIPRESALLSDTSSLTAYRSACARQPVAVLIDLDPGDRVFDGALPETLGDGSADVLAALREEGVAIGWISAAPAADEQQLRQRLREAGWDSAGEDRLLLRKGDQRKQQQRDAFDEAYCVVAILGDSRTDFDELFGYLRNPDDGHVLDEMIGRGWFLMTGDGERSPTLSDTEE